MVDLPFWVLLLLCTMCLLLPLPFPVPALALACHSNTILPPALPGASPSQPGMPSCLPCPPHHLLYYLPTPPPPLGGYHCVLSSFSLCVGSSECLPCCSSPSPTPACFPLCLCVPCPIPALCCCLTLHSTLPLLVLLTICALHRTRFGPCCALCTCPHHTTFTVYQIPLFFCPHLAPTTFYVPYTHPILHR